MFVCLFIGVLGRSDYYGHYAPITHVKNLSGGVYHGESDVRDVRKKTARSDPGGIVSKEMAKIDVRRNIPKMTSAATTVPRAFQQYVRNRQRLPAEGTLGSVLATEKVFMGPVGMADPQSTEGDLIAPASARA